MSKGFTTYAQNFEDLMLSRALGHIETGFYIDVGAQHPVIDSVSKVFYDRGWRGINIEPVPLYADELRKLRPGDEIIQAAVGKEEGIVKFHVIANTGLSTAVDSIANASFHQGLEGELIEVPVVTLAGISRKLGSREVHWLKIDVEGYEKQVLEGWDPDLLQPWIIVVEATLPNTATPNHSEWEHLLQDRGYRFVYHDGLNRFYLHPDHEGLRDAFATPPNVFDDLRLTPHASMCRGIVAVHARNMQDYEHAILQHERTIRSLESTISDQLKSINDQQQAINVLHRELSESRASYSAVLASLSWQLTAPLRTAGELALKLRALITKRSLPALEGDAGSSNLLSEEPLNLSPATELWLRKLRATSHGEDR